MDEIIDIQPPRERIPLKYAGFWIRLAACLIDAVVIIMVMVIFSFLGGAITTMNNQREESLALWVILFYAVLIFGHLFYFTFMESSTLQGTLGKITVGIKVGDARGNKLSFATALGRTASKWLSQLVFGIGFIMVAWDSEKQGLHEKIADTYVFEDQA